jgi:hypothetical protein
MEADAHSPSAAVQPLSSPARPPLLDDLTRTEPTCMNESSFPPLSSSPSHKLALIPQDPCDLCIEPTGPNGPDSVSLPVPKSTLDESVSMSFVSGEDESAALLAYLEQLDRELDEEEEKVRMASSSPTDSKLSPSISMPSLPKDGGLPKQTPSVQASQCVFGSAMFGGPSLSEIPHTSDALNWANVQNPGPPGTETVRARTRTSKQAIIGLFETPLDSLAKDISPAAERRNWVDKPMTLEMVAGIDPQRKSRNKTSQTPPVPPSMPPSTHQRGPYLSSPSAPQDYSLSARTSLPSPQQRRGISLSSPPQPSSSSSEVPRRPPIQMSPDFSNGAQASIHNPSNSLLPRPPFAINTSLPLRPESKSRSPLSGGVATSIHNPNYKPVNFQQRPNTSLPMSQNQHSLPYPSHQYQSVHSGGQNVPSPFQSQPKAAHITTTPFTNRSPQSLLPSPFPRDGMPPSHRISSQPPVAQPIGGGFNGSVSPKPIPPPSMTPPTNGNLALIPSPLFPHPPLPQSNLNRNNSTHVRSRSSPPQRFQSVSKSVFPLSAADPLSHPAPPTSKGVIRFLPPPLNHPLPPKPNLTIPSGRIPAASARSTTLPFPPPIVAPLANAQPSTAQMNPPHSRGASQPTEETVLLPQSAHIPNVATTPESQSSFPHSDAADTHGLFDRPKSAMDSCLNPKRPNNSQHLWVEAQTRAIETRRALGTLSQQGTRQLRPVRSLEHFGKPWLAIHRQSGCAQPDSPVNTPTHERAEGSIDNPQHKHQLKVLPMITLDVDSGLAKYNHRISSLPSLKLQT